MDINNIANRIKELREEKGLSQNKLAKDLYVKQQTIAQWEKGERALKAEAIIALSEYFNVTSDYLLGISEYKTSQAADIGVVTGLSDENIKILTELQHEFVTTNEEKQKRFYEGRKAFINKYISMLIDGESNGQLLEMLYLDYILIEDTKFELKYNVDSFTGERYENDIYNMQERELKYLRLMLDKKNDCEIFQSIMDGLLDYDGVRDAYLSFYGCEKKLNKVKEFIKRKEEYKVQDFSLDDVIIDVTGETGG